MIKKDLEKSRICSVTVKLTDLYIQPFCMYNRSDVFENESMPESQVSLSYNSRVLERERKGKERDTKKDIIIRKKNE